MTTLTPVPLENLAQRIAQQQAQLAKLRREHKVRQNQLATLMRRKKTLQQQLQRVEGQIKAVAGAQGAKPSGSVKQAPKATKSPARKPTPGARPMSAVLVDLIRAAGGKPMTVGQLTQEVLRRRIPTSSRKPRKMIENRAYELVKRGVLRRAPNGSGFVLGKTTLASASTSKASTGKPQGSSRPASRNGAAAKTTPAKTGSSTSS